MCNQIIPYQNKTNFVFFRFIWSTHFTSLKMFQKISKMDKFVKTFRSYCNTLNLFTEKNITYFNSTIIKLLKIFTLSFMKMSNFILDSSSIQQKIKFRTLKNNKIATIFHNKLNYEKNHLWWTMIYLKIYDFLSFFVLK